MTRTKELATRWLPLIIWMALIFAMSHQPSGSIPDYGQWDVLVKKMGHLLAYGILALLALRTGLEPRICLILVLAYAISDELHQRTVTGRNGTAIDVLIDLLGATMALLLVRLLPPGWREFRWDRTSGSDGQSPRDAL